MMAANQDLRAVEDAQKRLSEMLALAPNNVDILDLALTKLRLGKPEEAAEELEQALAKFPAHLQSSVDLLKLTQKDLAGAQQVLQNAVKAAPQSADAALALGRFYLFSGKPEQAQAEVYRALQIDPNNGPALQTLAGMQFSAGMPTRRSGHTSRSHGCPTRNTNRCMRPFSFGRASVRRRPRNSRNWRRKRRTTARPAPGWSPFIPQREERPMPSVC